MRAKPKFKREGASLLTVLLAAALAVALSPTKSGAAELPFCGGNQTVKVVPAGGAFECRSNPDNTNNGTFDGTKITAVLRVTETTVTATYTLATPRSTPTPIRVKSHRGLSSNDNGESDSENNGADFIPAGALTGTLTVPLQCGQIDVKAVFVGNGDARGRVTAPWVTNSYNCVPGQTTTTTTLPGSSTSGPTTLPGTSGPTTAPSVSVSITGTIPATGPVSPVRGAYRLALAAIAIACAMIVIARRRPEHDPA